jgi:hypothetical protein
MMSLAWFILFVAVTLFVAYRRFSLLNATIAFTALVLAYTVFTEPDSTWGVVWRVLLWLALAPLWLLTMKPFRQAFVTRPFLRTYKRLLPSMSSTEKEALEAGTVWWDGELFTGGPHWNKLLSARPPRLSADEQAFLDGPCEELCRMLDDFDITHRIGDAAACKFIKAKGLRHDHPALRWAEFPPGHSSAVKIGSRSANCLPHRGAKLAGTRGAAAPLRHRGAEEPLSAAPGARRGSAVLRAHRPAGRLRRRFAPRHRHRLQRYLQGP